MRTSALARLALALVLSMLGGLILAALAFPLVGGAGLVARAGAKTFLDLPAELKTGTLPERTRILDKDGHVITSLFLQNRVPVALADVPLTAQTALIAIEDSRFYEHNGIDVRGTVRALARNSSSGSVQQGGSTLTQQYVKNALLEENRGKPQEQNAARERSVKRKLQEARYALALEKKLSKAQILEGYLNIAYYGNGTYGIGTAANHYFSEPVQRLTIAQGAMLAGIVQNPTRFNPEVHPAATKARRNIVLTRMYELKKVSGAAYRTAMRAPLGLHITAIKSGCEAPGVQAAYFCDYVLRYLESAQGGAALGSTVAERQDLLLAGGLTIRTNLDPKVQRSAQAAVDAEVPAHDPSGVAAAVDTVEPGTGAVRAMAVDRTYGQKRGQTKVNLALGGSLGFQAGSTFKMFVLASALKKGIPLSTSIDSPPRYESTVFKDCTNGCGPYKVSNAEASEGGTFQIPEATWKSVNTFYIQLEERTGVEAPAALAESMGVHKIAQGSARPLGLNGSFVLGTDGVSPLDMAGAYATLAAHGRYCPPKPVASITRADGTELNLHLAPCSRVLEAGVADTVTSVLRGVIDGPAPSRTGKGASIGRPAAGKTGTVQESKAAWFVGYTPQLATAVWVGNPIPTRLLHVTINHHFYRSLFGGQIPASIWRRTMSGALQGVPVVDLAAADPETVNGSESLIPDVTGQPVDAATGVLTDLGFTVRVGSPVSAGPIPDGSVAFSQPRAGSSIPAGSEVVLVPSNGQIYIPPPPPPQPVPSVTVFFPPPPPIVPPTTPPVTLATTPPATRKPPGPPGPPGPKPTKP